MFNKYKKGEKKMKINIKTRINISVREIKTIDFKDIKTIHFMEINKRNMVGDNVAVRMA